MSRHPDRDSLHAFVDGRLGRADADRVAGHLDGCWACAGRLRELDAVRAAALDLRGPVEPARDLWPAIEARVRGGGVRGSGGGGVPGSGDEAGRGSSGGAVARNPAGARSVRRASSPARWAAVAAVLTLAALGTLRLASPRDPAGAVTAVDAAAPAVEGATPEDATPAVASAAGLEARYAPELRRLATLVESRSSERGLDVASASEPDLSAFRSVRAELVEAVSSAPEPGPLLVELEAAYERERRYLARLVEIVGP